jgi:hypothetical protein
VLPNSPYTNPLTGIAQVSLGPDSRMLRARVHCWLLGTP